MTDVQKADDYLYETLGEDGALIDLLQPPTATVSTKSIYWDSVPQGVPRTGKPVIIIRHKPSSLNPILRANFGTKLISDFYYQIVASVGIARYIEADLVADRIETLLDLGHSSGKILKVEKLGDYRTKNPDSSGKEYAETGADWLIQVSQFA